MNQDKVQIDFTQLSKRDAVIAVDAAKNTVVIVLADPESEVAKEISDRLLGFGFSVEELSSSLLVHVGYAYLASEVAELVSSALEKVGLKVDRDFPARSADGRLRRPCLR